MPRPVTLLLPRPLAALALATLLACGAGAPAWPDDDGVSGASAPGRAGDPGGPGNPGGPSPGGPAPGPPPGLPRAGGGAPLAIPADEPSWARLSGLLDRPEQYGEASWDDVRMRVVGHAAAVGRDRARARAARSDLAGCAEAYRTLATRLEAIPTASATGAPIRAALLAAARRDAALCDALAAGAPLPSPTGTIAPLRARFYALAQRTAPDRLHREAQTLATDARTLARDARATAEAARADAAALSLDGFADFDARHRLRVALVEAYADAVDPLRVAEPWGYWEPGEIALAADTIAAAAEALASAVPTDGAALAAATAPDALVPRRDPVPWTADGLGALPTGDAYIDVAGFPGPRAIGTLSVLALEDPTHRAWLDAQVATLAATPTSALPDAVLAIAAELDRKPYGSRYYNVKQLKNAGIRALASRGDHAGARRVLATSWPLHAQDWACPNRAGILRGLEARLLVAADEPAAETALDAADAEIATFLAHVAEVEARGPAPGAPGGGLGPTGPPLPSYNDGNSQTGPVGPPLPAPGR